MGTNVGEIGLDLVVYKNNFNKQMSGITSLAKKAGAALAGAFAVKKLVDFSKSCVELGSDLQEVQNVVDVTFPKMQKQVNSFAKNAAASFGLNETMAKKFTGTFGAMSKAFGFSEKEAYKMSTSLTGLAGDVASFYNITQDEAYTKLKSVFTGETESLKDLGVVMTQSALDAFALSNGFGKTTKSMTEAEKVALRYKFVQNQLAAAQGDFIRTSNGWANQTRVLALQFDSLKASIGQGLINVLTPVIKMFNMLISKLLVASNAFKKFTETVFGNAGGSESSSASTIADGMDSASSSASDIEKATGKTAKNAKKIEKSVLGFDKLNKLSGDKVDSNDTNAGSAGVSTGNTRKDTGKEDKSVSKLSKALERLNKALQPTTQALGRLKTALKPLGNFTYQALTDFYNHFLKPVGEWTLGTGLPRFIDAISNGLNEINWEKINGALVKLWDALAPFSITIGEGLLWLWENVLVPISTWTANNILPLFLESLAAVIEILNGTIDALKPLGKWMFENFLKPLAVWTGGIIVTVLEGIVSSLEHFSDWVSNNKSLIQGIAIDVAVFFAAWKTTELLSFIQQSGGCVSALKNIAKALVGTRIAKVKDKLETMYLTGLYAKDFVLGLASSIKQLAIQGVQFAKVTALKVANKIATIGMTVATTAWNAVCTIATVITTAFGAAVAFLTSPIGLVVLAIGALIAIGVLLYKNWDKISTFAKKAFEKIRENVSKAFHGIKKIFSGIGKWFCARFTDVTNAFKNAPSWFKNKFTNVVSVIKQKFSPVTKFFSGIWNGIKNTTSKVWDTITGMFGKGKKIFSGFKDGVLSVFKGIVGTLIKGINKVIKMPFDKINGLLNKIRNTKILKVKPFAKLWKENPIPTPQIPKLAQGGYVKANTPQLAMIGDNRHQGEIVAPEDKLYKVTSSAVINALKPFISAISNSGTGNTPDKLYLTINLGNSKIAKEVALSISRENRRVGKAVYNLT